MKLCYLLVHIISFSLLTGLDPAKEAVLRAKEGVHAYSRHAPSAPIHDGPPPPYTPTNPIDNSSYNPYYTSHSSSPQLHMGFASENSNPFHSSSLSLHSYQSPEARDDGPTRDLLDFDSPNRNPFHQDDSNRYVFKYVNKM